MRILIPGDRSCGCSTRRCRQGAPSLDADANWTVSTGTVLKPREHENLLKSGRKRPERRPDRTVLFVFVCFCLHSTRQRLKEQYWDTERDCIV